MKRAWAFSFSWNQRLEPLVSKNRNQNWTSYKRFDSRLELRTVVNGSRIDNSSVSIKLWSPLVMHVKIAKKILRDRSYIQTTVSSKIRTLWASNCAREFSAHWTCDQRRKIRWVLGMEGGSNNILGLESGSYNICPYNSFP